MNAPAPYGDLNAQVAQALTRLREMRGMSIAELARRSGIGLRSLHRYMRGERELTLGLVQAIAEALDYDAADVLSLVKEGGE